MVKIRLEFSNASKERLEALLKDAIEKFDLKAEYQDGVVYIIGPQVVLQEIAKAYEVKKLMSNLSGDFFR